MAKLYRVTITGADDAVDPNELLELSARYPFVEWAMLQSTERNGTPRFPSESWMYAWAVAQQERAPNWYPWAIHLCGKLSRHAMAGDVSVGERIGSFNAPLRVQLNGFSKYRLPLLAVALRHQSIEFILQCSTFEAQDHAVELKANHQNTSYLCDASGGKGIAAEFFPRAESHVGYAGGIAPDNVDSVVRALQTGPGEQRFWIDMESGVRTDDHFDMDKVRAVLERVAPLVRLS